jgi:hypothetical protein
LDTRAQILTAVQPLIEHFMHTLGIDEAVFALIWEFYLFKEIFSPLMPSREFWQTRRGQCASVSGARVDSPPSGAQVPWAPLCAIALRLCDLPCSEAAVERVFSHLRFLFGDYRHSLSPDLIEAMLVIRLN